MDLVTIPGGAFDLGWRHALPRGIWEDEEAASLVDLYVTSCSPARTVTLSEFQIARTPIPLSELIGNPYELDGIDTLASLCDLIDERLAPQQLRLPTEDELEAAAGGSLFPWGTVIPDGIPYAGETSFADHKKPNAFGLELLGDPYQVELCRCMFKFGDGGTALCGGHPWPLAWLPLSPSFRWTDADSRDCFPETLEGCFVRPVRLV